MIRAEFDNIPEELRRRNNWVCVRNGSKCPFTAYANDTASSSNPNTWSPSEVAWKGVQCGFYDGVGYCFDNTDIVGIDIDDGFDEDGFITEKAAYIIDELHSYTEISRSGRGFHIFVKGQLPFAGRNNQKGVEIYRAGRYFITTGRMLFYPDIIENQGGINWVVSKHFPEMVHQAREYNQARAKAMYAPTFVQGEKISVNPVYPDIPKGCRNVSMLSLAGSLMRAGMTEEWMEREMRMVNSTRCQPPLTEGELRTIIRQAKKYR